MIEKLNSHIIGKDDSVREVLSRLDKLAADAILFLVDEDSRLLGSLTDGDIRRGLIRGLGLEDKIEKFILPRPKFFTANTFNLEQLQKWRTKNFKIIPVLDEEKRIIDIVNFRLQRSFLPIDAVIMAGGKGTRLRPLTLETPKPLLKVDDKPIIEYNIDRLKDFGIKNINISINYLGEQIVDYFKDGAKKGLSIKYVNEDTPLGTLGSVSLIDDFTNEYILVMNSDLLTNIDYEEMFKELIKKEADMVVATTPYEVKIPYGIIETEGERVVDLHEKPTYTYYSNAGIYIIRKELLNLIPKKSFFNATDLMEKLCKNGNKLIHYPILGYWLDIGKPQDFEKAQRDIKHLTF